MKLKRTLLLSIPFWVVTLGVSALTAANVVANEDMAELSVTLLAISIIFGYTAYTIQKGKTYGYVLGIVLAIVLVAGYIILTVAGSSALEQCGSGYEYIGCRLGAVSLKIIAWFLLPPAIITAITAPLLISTLLYSLKSEKRKSKTSTKAYHI